MIGLLSKGAIAFAMALISLGVLDAWPTCQAQTQTNANTTSRIKSRNRNYPMRDRRTVINLKNKHLNAIFGGFEQGSGIGGGIELTTADLLPNIEFRATALVSTRLYRAAELETYIPKIGDEKTHANIWYRYSRRTKDRFYGIGPVTTRSNKTNFDLEQRDISGSLYRDFTDEFQAGVYVGYSNADAYRGQNDDDPFIDTLFSNDPRVTPATRWAPGIHSGSRTVSYGLYAEYDRRNSDKGLTRGIYLYGRAASVDGLEKSAFSDYGWIEGEYDIRGYIPLGTDKTSLALRLASELKSPKGGSQIPFYNLARLGGRNYVRGFDTYRFYGNNSLLSSVELRQTVFTVKEDRGVDVIGFGDAGQVWGDSRSRTNLAVINNNRLDSSNWRASVGVGVQYRHSKSFGVRIDFGHSSEANKFYFSIGRGF